MEDDGILKENKGMNVLILTGKFGMGHWSASQALQQQLEREGHQVHTVDFFDYAMPELAPTLYRMFGWLVKYGGGLYNLFHRLTRNVEGDMPLAGAWVEYLEELLFETGADVVVSTHPVCSSVVARYKREGGVMPLVTCITDVTSHSEWIHPGTDCYLVASHQVRQGLVDKGVEAERILVSGIPVGQQFTGGSPNRGQRELLIMGGGLGLMPRRDRFYEQLNALPGVHVTILTGHNEKLYQRLHGKYENIEVVGFTTQVDLYMARAHLMLSKPGGITVFEAIASRLPMLVWAPFLDQERENARFLLEAGMARLADKEEEACLWAIESTLYDEAGLASMRRAMEKASNTMCRAAVCAVVEQLAGEKVYA